MSFYIAIKGCYKAWRSHKRVIMLNTFDLIEPNRGIVKVWNCVLEGGDWSLLHIISKNHTLVMKSVGVFNPFPNNKFWTLSK